MHHKGALAGENGDSPGQYQLIPRIRQSVVDPSDDVIINLFVTGYGRIDNSKIVFYPPSDVIDVAGSAHTHGMHKHPETQMLAWGGYTQSMDDAGFTQSLGGMRHKKWDGATLFFDAENTQDDSVPQIITETTLGPNGENPFQIKLKISKNARPGTYVAYTVLTYFNGERWEISNIPISFTIRNAFQRNEYKLNILAYFAAAFTILGAVASIISIFNNIKSWFL